MTLFSDRLQTILLGREIQLAFSMEEYLLLTFGVFEAQLVEAATAFGAGCLQSRSCPITRKLVGWNLFGVVHTTGHEWAVRVSLQKFDHHLLSYSRDA